MKRTVITLVAAIACLYSNAQLLTTDVTVSMIPDSIKISSNAATAYYIGTDNPAVMFFTENADLYGKIVAYLKKNITARDTVYQVRLRGTRIDPLSKFYRREFPFFGDLYTKKARQINGYGIYRLTNYMPAAVSKDDMALLPTPEVNQNQQTRKKFSPPHSGYNGIAPDSDW